MKNTPKLRARRMWANYYPKPYNPTLHSNEDFALGSCGKHCEHTVPVAVIPLDDLYALGDSMVSALTAIGVLPRQRKGGTK